MRYPAGWLTIVLLMAPGCLFEDDGEFFTGYVDGVTMTARHDSYAHGWCFSSNGGGDGRCHWVQVTVDNTVNENDLDVSTFHWSGVGSDGGVYENPTVDGPDAIAAGSRGTLRVGFEVGDSVSIDRVRFGAFDDIYMQANV